MARVVLIIDDDAAMRMTLERTVKQAGYEAVSAADGNEGLKVCHSRPVDLAITDLFMPNKEGMETIMELRRDFPKIAIVAISGMPNAAPLLTTARLLGAARAWRSHSSRKRF
jgi:Response regulator containing CheY-like receiver, AAA-type ATPase, and DNA-binding domains